MAKKKKSSNNNNSQNSSKSPEKVNVEEEVEKIEAKVEEPKAEAPAPEAPAPEEPKAEEPKAEEPKNPTTLSQVKKMGMQKYSIEEAKNREISSKDSEITRVSSSAEVPKSN